MNQRNKAAADEVRATHSAVLARLFDTYVRRMLAKRFTGVRLLGDTPDAPHVGTDRALIVYCNHSSWYDPLIVLSLGRGFFPGHVPYGPMDADALEKYAFMKKLGLFGVERDTARGAARFLQVARGLLASPPAALWITPQGEFRDVRERPVTFKPGLGHLAETCDTLILPLAIEIVYWSEARAEVLLHFGQVFDTREHRRDSDQWTAVLEDALTRAQDELAAASMSREPDRFALLIDGTTGVNFAYDTWRYLKALVRREKFSTAHSDINRPKD